jgi:cell division protein FtsZ
VGEDAEIIWGAVVDETLGEELRVTVIATGIGGVGESAFITRGRGRTLRGVVRDVTPADLQTAVDYDEPTFIRQQDDPVDESMAVSQRGYKGIVIDNDLDIPTFLRRKAD